MAKAQVKRSFLETLWARLIAWFQRLLGRGGPQNHPVILIPGFTGSRLKTLFEGDENYATWINAEAIEQGTTPQSEAYQAGTWWLEQMILQADGMTPQQNVPYNRSLEGWEAISVLDPTDDSFNSNYFLKLIRRLQSIGYTRQNLRAAAYDWRLPPAGLESRFQYFSELKSTIERLRLEEGLRVVLLGHSLGNRIVQYFLQWIVNEDPANGKEWIDHHICRYIAVSALWLGVPKSIHEGLADLGHLGIMTISGVKPLYQSFGALPWMLPVTKSHYPYLNVESFAFLENDENPLSISEAWELGSAFGPLSFRQRYYEADPNFTKPGTELGSLAVELPYVESLAVLHASGQPTEVGAYYRRAADDTLVIDTEASSTNPDFSVMDGVRLEVQGKTPQYIDGSFNSGDGFLPYGSLMYYTEWQKKYPDREIVGQDYPGNTHYNVLENDAFLDRVCALVSF